MPKEIFVVLNSIRSAYNVGSIFRTADAAGVSKIYLCGYTPRPDQNDKIKKTALGAEKWVPWEHHKQTWRLLKQLKSEGIELIALEQTKKSRNIFTFKPKFPIAIVLGNEVKGLSLGILKYCDKTIAIPMHGRKESLNVAVSTGIALYQMIKYY